MTITPTFSRILKIVGATFLFTSVRVFADQCYVTNTPLPVTINGCTFSGSLPNNSTSYVQNGLTPTTTTQSYSVQQATVTDGLTIPYVTGQCLQTDSQGKISGSGGVCGAGGGGGGSGNGTVLVSTQNNIAYYTGVGTTTVGGLLAGTSGYSLLSSGSSAPPFWGQPVSTITATSLGALTSVTADSPLSGSGTSASHLTIVSTITAATLGALTAVTADSPLSCSGTSASHLTIVSTITAASLGALTGNQTITLSGDVTGTGTTAITATIANTIPNAHTFSGSTTFNSAMLISSVIYVSNGEGSSGQVLQSGGTGAPSWQTIGGGGTVNPTGTIAAGNIAKFTSVAGTTISSAAAVDIVNAFSGCSGTQYLGADGACHTPSAGGGGSSSLEVGYGTTAGFTVSSSSPTGSILYDQTQFKTSLQGSATAFITIAYSTQSNSGSYTISSTTSSVVMANCPSACTVTLPTAIGASGRVYQIKILGTGVTSIATTASQTIDGSTTITPNPNQYSSIEVLSDGSNWSIL
jgi:hypothetical protein